MSYLISKNRIFRKKRKNVLIFFFFQPSAFTALLAHEPQPAPHIPRNDGAFDQQPPPPDALPGHAQRLRRNKRRKFRPPFPQNVGPQPQPNSRKPPAQHVPRGFPPQPRGPLQHFPQQWGVRPCYFKGLPAPVPARPPRERQWARHGAPPLQGLLRHKVRPHTEDPVPRRCIHGEVPLGANGRMTSAPHGVISHARIQFNWLQQIRLAA